MEEKKYVVEVEKGKEAKDGRPSVGPVYRSVTAKDGFPPLLPGMETCWDIFRNSVEKFPENRMVGYRETEDGKVGDYVWLTYKEVYEIVMKVGASIRSCGISKGARCGIYSTNCPKWIISMQACNAHGLYCVPLYDSLGAGAVEYIICHAEVSIAFVEEKKISEVLKTLPNTRKYLKTLVSFGKVKSDQKEEAERMGLTIHSWDEFLLLGNNQQFDLPAKKKSDICTIMYTSGTTSEPKGVLISNETVVTVVSGIKFSLTSINEELMQDDVYLSYLPLAHIFDRVVEELFISIGASIGYWRGDVKLLSEDIKDLKPTILCSVPRVLDRIYSGLMEKISSAGALKRTLFNVAYSYKLSNMNNGYRLEEASPIFDKIVFSKIKEGLGGKLRLILSGGAPLAPSVETFLRVVTCAHVLQGYGLTESCAASFIAQPNDMAMVGTVGPPVPNVDVCLESVPEMGYDALLSTTPRGEICIRGNTLFTGYHKREDLTEEVMFDGWFHTGDIGEWQPDGCMKIIDRKKNIFKLSQGEYVSVENLENIYSLASEIDSAWVYGNSFESFLVAVVNPNKHALESWAQEHEVAGDFSSLCQHPRAKAYILEKLNKIARENKLKGFELIKAVHLDPMPFDMERDLLTPTFKKKRPQLLKYYKDVIDTLYQEQNEKRQS
ncbi:long chain acyl-CoA synthetase 4 [Beta vulgaris subsp. vulgaris]|uniref:long chain acyl-CoA synthetase 4 n=1 Tax=Beta vulgaris subsp. vulgaris TaxID=3555 RepID=UPI00203741C3|nr:long chain acyl-CoA synthetase 4 [Beta vulgaris subsp. vulgaris]